MDDLGQRLAALTPTIEKLMDIAGTPGLSLGVSVGGKIIHTANFGYRDVAHKLPTTSDTIYPACSLTKALVAATLGMLVEDEKVQWNTLVKDILPEFNIRDDTIRTQATLADFLVHRTGMSVGNHYLGAENNVLIQKEDTLAFISDQEAIKPFRGQWQYNNLGYEIIGLAIDKVSGSSWGDLMINRIFKPLGLKRTLLDFPPDTEHDVAKAYCVLDDATPTEIQTVQATDKIFSGAAAGLRTCVNDLLILYNNFMVAANDQFASSKTSTPNSPLKQVSQLMSAKALLNDPTFHETSYAFGWARVQLPGPMGAVGCNPSLMPDGMPTVGKDVPSRLVIYHQGSLPGALSAVNLIPESQTAVVVMSNSLSLNDCPDWVGQLLLEEILEVPHRNDYIEAAKISGAKNLEWYPTVLEELKNEQKPNTSAKELDSYVGTYWNAIKTMKIEVTVDEKQLYWVVQGLDSEKYALDHYEDDVFLWLKPRNVMAARGRWVDQGKEFWKIKFKSSDGKIDRLTWVHDVEVTEGETFFRKS